MCLGVYPVYIPTHIHPYIRKSRLLLEISGCIDELCLQWTPYMPGITVQYCSVACDGTQPLGLNINQYGTNNTIQGASTPLGPLEYHRSDRKYSAQPKATVNTNTYRYPHISPDPIQVGPF